MEQLFYENKHVKVSYIAEANAGIARWEGFVAGKFYRDALDSAIELYKTKSTGKWIANLQNMESITEADQQWANEDWFPRALGVGLNRLAIIIGGDLFNQMDVNEIMSKVESIGLVTQYFDSEHKAIEWIKAQ